jgi:hypothetical protein
MQFTGRNLRILRDALTGAIAHTNHEIGLHPMPLAYPEDIEALEAECARYERLLARVDAEIQKGP